MSTLQALRPAAEALAADRLVLRYTDILAVAADTVRSVQEQDGGTHAGEIETSIMLYIAPESVDMSRAARDYHPGKGRLTRAPGGTGVYSQTGIYGDATLAAWAKGRAVVEAMVDGILRDIQSLRTEPLPPPAGPRN